MAAGLLRLPGLLPGYLPNGFRASRSLAHFKTAGFFAQNPLVDWETLPLLRKGVRSAPTVPTTLPGALFRDFRNVGLNCSRGMSTA